MIVIYGSRMYGKIDRSGESYIGTLFAHVYWMPLFPLGSKLVLAENGDNTYRFIPAGLNLRSVLAGYLRTWGVLGAIGALFVAVEEMNRPEVEALDVALTVIAALVCIAAVVGAFAWLGKLSADQRGQREVYQDYAGHPIDVAMMREGIEPLRQRIYAHVVERAHGLISGGYRTTVDPSTHWGAIALDPTVTDVQFLRAALTLTRLEWALADASTKAQLDNAHTMIWQKLTAMGPVSAPPAYSAAA